MSDPELQKFFEFDDSDLNANRLGRLSTKQQKKLTEGERFTRKIFIGAGLVFILIAAGVTVGMIGSAIKRGLTFSNISTDDILGMAVGIGLPWLVLGFFALGAFRLAATKFDNSVQCVEGKVNFVKVEKEVSSRSASGSTTSHTVEEYELRVGRVKFEDVDEELLNIIEEGDVYAFYYTKDAKDILSAEFVKKGK
jgi:hypothetical protein